MLNRSTYTIAYRVSLRVPNVIIVPVDKAAQNISFVCKKFYFSVLLKEVGLFPGSSSETYRLVNELETEICGKQINFIRDNFENVVTNRMLLPIVIVLYHSYTSHPNFIKLLKFRFIVSSLKVPIKLKQSGT